MQWDQTNATLLLPEVTKKCERLVSNLIFTNHSKDTVEIESYWWSGSRKKVVPAEEQ
jgi:hypothetical protein